MLTPDSSPEDIVSHQIIQLLADLGLVFGQIPTWLSSAGFGCSQVNTGKHWALPSTGAVPHRCAVSHHSPTPPTPDLRRQMDRRRYRCVTSRCSRMAPETGIIPLL